MSQCMTPKDSSLPVCLLGDQGCLIQFGMEWQTLHILRTGYGCKRIRRSPFWTSTASYCYGLSQKCNWFECDHAVFQTECHLNQQGLSAEHLIASSWNRQKANEIFHNFSSCNTRIINELVLGETLHKWQHVQLMIDDYKHYCVYKMPSWLWQAKCF